MKYKMIVLAALIVTGQPDWAMSQAGLSGTGSQNGETSYNVRTLDFDLWCQLTQRYSSERCSNRRSDDMKDFEQYRATVERFELGYLKQLQRYQDLRTYLTRDPLQTVQHKQDGLP